MKKSTFTILLAALFIVQGLAQQVTQEQRLLITKRTATWCPTCGSWGWTIFEHFLEDNHEKAVLIAAHYDGILSTPAGEEITDNFGGFYQPRFFVNDMDQNVNSGNLATVRTAVKNQVDAAFAATPVANAGFNPVYADGALKVDAKVKFFQAAQGEYYLGIYLVEDNVVAFQASIGSNANHMRVFRESFTAGTWGNLIVNGSAAANEEFSLNYSLAIGDPAGYDYDIVGIIWKKEGEKYIPVNAWSTTEINTSTATTVQLTNEEFAVYPSVTSTEAFVQLDLGENQAAAQIDLVDLNGRTIATIFRGALATGTHTFTIDRNAVPADGLYLVRFQAGNQAGVRKVVFQ